MRKRGLPLKSRPSNMDVMASGDQFRRQARKHMMTGSGYRRCFKGGYIMAKTEGQKLEEKLCYKIQNIGMERPEDVEKAIAVFCTCVKMSALEKLGV